MAMYTCYMLLRATALFCALIFLSVSRSEEWNILVPLDISMNNTGFQLPIINELILFMGLERELNSMTSNLVVGFHENFEKLNV